MSVERREASRGARKRIHRVGEDSHGYGGGRLERAMVVNDRCMY